MDLRRLDGTDKRLIWLPLAVSQIAMVSSAIVEATILPSDERLKGGECRTCLARRLRSRPDLTSRCGSCRRRLRKGQFPHRGESRGGEYDLRAQSARYPCGEAR